MLENAASSPQEVAKVILQAVTSKSPQLRYTVGNDASNIQAKTTMSDTELRFNKATVSTSVITCLQKSILINDKFINRAI
jgi:hypothetical protein